MPATVTYSYSQLVSLYATANGLSPSSAEALTMGAVAMAESSGDPNARNPSGASGLWQIMPSHVSDSGWNLGSNFYDPATNARMAYFVLHRQGYTAWTTYTSGAYRKFMGGTVAAQNVSIPGWPTNPDGSAVNPLQAAGSAVAGAATNVLGLPAGLMDPGFWRRVGLAMLGIFVMIIGLVILLRRPLETAAAIA